MAGRKIVFATDEYYHVFNRGIARQPTFFSKRDYDRFLLTLSYYRFADVQVKLSRFLQLSLGDRENLLADLKKRNKKHIDILCYALMPNHFHLLLRQSSDAGVSTFLSKVTNSYTRYVNTKQERVGDLFQGVFKAVHIETDEQLVHVSRYIHINPFVSYIIKKEQLLTYPWISLHEYMGNTSGMLDTSIVLSHFKTAKAYEQFVFDQLDYAKKLEDIKHLLIEE